MFVEFFREVGWPVQVSTVLYGLAALTFLGACVRGRSLFSGGNPVSWMAFFLFVVAFLVNTWLLGDLWVEAGRAPFKTRYETLLFYPWCIALVYLVIRLLYDLDVIGAILAVACTACFVVAVSRPDLEIVNLPPALRSAWFVPHVVAYFVSYAFLLASAAFAALFLFWPRWRIVRTGEGLESMYMRFMYIGFVLLTVGLVLGSVWGEFAWGNYWGWDPKENWALISWFVFLINLHLHHMPGVNRRVAASVCVIGFVAVLFTYLGMHLLPTAGSSIHVYQ
jgi:ABC-type transport system involved in cytochrome c biogenesis permease subunit